MTSTEVGYLYLGKEESERDQGSLSEDEALRQKAEEGLDRPVFLRQG